MSRLRWRGDVIKAKVDAAAKAAIDELTEEAAEEAKASHWWRNRSDARLEGEITNEPAKRVGHQLVGKFGSTQGRGFYGLFLERRTPFLRPAGDATFRQLARRIKRKTRFL